MIEFLKNNKKFSIIISVIAIIVLTALFFIFKPNISFNRNYESVEFGNEYSFEEFILKTNPIDAEVIYPDFKPTELGNYTLPFSIKTKHGVHTEEFTFSIIDSRKPVVTLFYQDVNVLLRLNSKDFNPLINIHKIENVDPSVINNVKEVDDNTYETLKQTIIDTNTEIRNRNITQESDLKQYDVEKNFIFYTTTLDSTVVGVYPIKVCIVDENYNLLEVSWNIEVIDSNEYLTSGGRVSCTYDGDDLNSNVAYNSTIVENYTYNPFKLVESYEIVTSMIFDEDYDTDENIDLMVATLKEKYSKFNEVEGVSVSISNSSSSVTTKIFINLTVYDKKKDSLNILKNKTDSEIEISAAVKEAENNNYICVIK